MVSEEGRSSLDRERKGKVKGEGQKLMVLGDYVKT